ncbi:F-box family protein with DUF295, partial [Prunus dulcis]
SAAKGVRRHGVDPNRSRNEEVMLFSLSPVSSLSPPAAALARPSSFPTSPAACLELISETGPNKQHPADVPLPTSAAAVVGIGRNLPWKSTVRPNAIRTSSRSISSVSQPNQSSEVSGARQNFKRRPPRDRSSSDHLR